MSDPLEFIVNRGSGGAFTLSQDTLGGAPVFSSTAGVPFPDPDTSGYQLRGVYLCGNPLTYNGDAYLQRGGPLTGVGASPFGSASFWVNLYQVAGTGIFPWTGNTSHNWYDSEQEYGIDAITGPPNKNQPFVSLGNSSLFQSQGAAGSAGTSASPPGPDGHWYHVLLSWNTDHASGARILQCYIDDASVVMTPVVDTGTAFSIDYPAFVDVFGINQPSGTFPMGDVWFAPGEYIDFSVVSNRRKFIDDSGNPVFLGASGEIPLGVAPAMFFTIPPFDPTTPDVKIAKTPDKYNVVFVTGDYQIRRTEKRVHVNSSAACTLRLPMDIGVQPMPAGLGQGPVFDTVTVIKDVSGDASSNNITIVDPRGLLLDDQASFVLNQDYQSQAFGWNGAGWSLLYGGITTGSPSIWNPVISLNGRLPNVSEVLARIPLSFATSLPAGLLDSSADCSVAFTSDGVFTLLKNGSSIGSVTIPAATTGRNVGVWSFASTVTFALDDEFSLQAPASQDPTGRDIAFSILGSR